MDRTLHWELGDLNSVFSSATAHYEPDPRASVEGLQGLWIRLCETLDDSVWGGEQATFENFASSLSVHLFPQLWNFPMAPACWQIGRANSHTCCSIKPPPPYPQRTSQGEWFGPIPFYNSILPAFYSALKLFMCCHEKIHNTFKAAPPTKVIEQEKGPPCIVDAIT